MYAIRLCRRWVDLLDLEASVGMQLSSLRELGTYHTAVEASGYGTKTKMAYATYVMMAAMYGVMEGAM